MFLLSSLHYHFDIKVTVEGTLKSHQFSEDVRNGNEKSYETINQLDNMIIHFALTDLYLLLFIYFLIS